MTMSQNGRQSARSHPQMLVRYKAWADERTYAILKQQSASELIKERPTTFKSILRTMHHIQIVDDIFKAHLLGADHGYSSRTHDSAPPVDALSDRAAAINQWWIERADRLSPEALREPVAFRFISGDPGVMTREEIICHVVQHATYHRGYVDDMMYQIPVIPPATDFPVFLQEYR